MNATPCTPARLGYTRVRSLETSHNAEPRPDSCGFFVPVPQASCARFPFSRKELGRISKYPQPSLCGFEPPSGAYPFGERFTLNLRKLP